MSLDVHRLDLSSSSTTYFHPSGDKWASCKSHICVWTWFLTSFGICLCFSLSLCFVPLLVPVTKRDRASGESHLLCCLICSLRELPLSPLPLTCSSPCWVSLYIWPMLVTVLIVASVGVDTYRIRRGEYWSTIQGPEMGSAWIPRRYRWGEDASTLLQVL